MLEFDEQIDPFTVADDEVGLVLNALMEERGVCTDHGESFEIGVGLVTAVVAEGVAEGGPACIVGIQETEAVDNATS